MCPQCKDPDCDTYPYCSPDDEQSDDTDGGAS